MSFPSFRKQGRKRAEEERQNAGCIAQSKQRINERLTLFFLPRGSFLRRITLRVHSPTTKLWQNRSPFSFFIFASFIKSKKKEVIIHLLLPSIFITYDADVYLLYCHHRIIAIASKNQENKRSLWKSGGRVEWLKCYKSAVRQIHLSRQSNLLR